MRIIRRNRLTNEIVHDPRCDECEQLVEKAIDSAGRRLCERCVTEALALLKFTDDVKPEELQP